MRLYGKNPVLERVKTAPDTIKKIFLQKRTDLSEIVKAIKKAGLVFDSVERSWMEEHCNAANAQGVMAEVDEFEYCDYGILARDCAEGNTVLLFLDGITDPQNLGSIIRNVSCVGGFDIVIPEHRSACVNETVLRIASGGENYLRIGRVMNVATALKDLKEVGVSVAGAVVDEGSGVDEAGLALPLAVVVGAEGKGIRPGVREKLDNSVSLIMEGAPISFNAAVASALLCYEIKRTVNRG